MCKSSIYASAALQSNIHHQLTSYNLRKSIIDSLFYLTTQKMLACNWKMLCWCDWNGPNFCMALLPFTVVDNVKEGLIFTNLSVSIICPPSSSDELNKTSELFAILSSSYGTEHKIQKLWIVRNATCCNYFFENVFVIYLQTLFSNYYIQ